MRFGRGEYASLCSFPSARCPSSRPLPKRFRERLWAWLTMAALGFAALVFMAGLALYVVGVDAIGNERLRLQAERAISRLAGFEADVTLGELRMGLGETSLFALEVRDARIRRADDGVLIASVGTLRFGLRPLPLFGGRVELGQIKLEDAELLPIGLSHLFRGSPARVVSPDLLREAIFRAARSAFELTRASGLDRVMLSRVGVLTRPGQAKPDLFVEKLDLQRGSGLRIDIEGTALYRGHGLTVGGHAGRDGSTGAIDTLSLDVALIPDEEQFEAAGQGALRSLGPVEVSMSGREAGGDAEEGWISLTVDARDILLGIDESQLLISEAALDIGFREGDEVFSLSSSGLKIGRSRLGLQGTIVPLPGGEDGPAYGFHLISNDAVVAPMDSPEPALPYAMRLVGRYEPLQSRVLAESIDIRTQTGELVASAALTIPAGMSPGISLAVDVSDMATAEAKQFWPWFAARGARNWTLENVFGGHVRDSRLRFSVPPGRLGNGIPLSHDELAGRFALENTRFDIAGDIPPVRDGTGWVEFRGTDVSVGLSSGAIYMPSERSVEVSQGTLKIKAAHLKPRIGKLEIDVKGEASAIVELASYKPIDAGRFHDLTPEDVSGQMSGRVSADVPLQAGIPAENLAWCVAFEYEDLSIAKPFEGQEVADATGSLLVQPDRAEFTAEAQLNAVPAHIRIVEPLRASAVERVRHVELEVDDAARERLFPGLGVLVSGPFQVTYDEQSDKRKKLTVSLDSARLTVPWIGWQKGMGIPATARFFLEQDGDALELQEFTLEGETFAVNGLVRLSGGALAEARLDRVRFNSSDDYSALIHRTGSGYSVSVDGSSIDARGIIKRVLGGKDGTGRSEGEGGEQEVAVTASLEKVHGFNGETLGQVELVYGSQPSRPEELTVRAATSQYGSVQLDKGGNQGRSHLRASSSNAGAVLRFLDIYEHVEGGQLSLSLSGADDDNLAGQIDIRDFWVVDEPRLRSLVAASSQDGASGQVDASRARFERGAAILSKGPQQLVIRNGVLRGPLIGSTFQGTLYDPNGNTDITGTFMPLYGINRIFGEIPIIGQILGNGRDRALIGITYRLSGKTGEPTLEINPISAIAPGIFRQLFEYQ